MPESTDLFESDPYFRMMGRLSLEAKANGQTQVAKNLHDIATWFGTRELKSDTGPLVVKTPVKRGPSPSRS